jgi:hypothetical protein
VRPDTAPAIDDPVIQRFLDRLAGGISDVLFLAAIIDLLSSDYDRFCAKELPSLLDSLANEQIGTNAIVGPMLRGNTRWDLTFAGRLSGRILPAQFVTKLPVRSFALPENELVKWLIDDLTKTVSMIESRVGSNALPAQLRVIRDGCRDSTKHQWFREVVPPRTLGAYMCTAAMRQRLLSYRRAARLAQRRNSYSSRDRSVRWKSILELLLANWLAPVSDDDLFELYALTLVLDLLETEIGFGVPKEFGLAAPGRSHIAKFAKGESIVRVYFDQSPVGFLNAPSVQLDILGSHDGVRAVPRRPDIVVVHDRGEDRRTLFVEVKRSADASYLSDSIYKAFGYITDFQACWSKIASNPKVVLLVPEHVALKDGVSVGNMSIVLVSSLDRAALLRCLNSGLGLSEAHDGKNDHY